MAHLWPLVGAAALLLWGAPGLALPPGTAGPPTQATDGSSSHSFRYAATVVSEPGPGLPQFMVVEYVDDHLISHYSSDTKKELPHAPWVEDNLDAHFWDTRTQYSRENEQECREVLGVFQNHYNQSKSSHPVPDFTTLQWTYGCKMNEEGQKGAYEKLAYDGEEVMSFDLETLSWRARSDARSQAIKRSLDGDTAYGQYRKNLLEEECIALLKHYLDYGKETLLRKDPPVLKVQLRKMAFESMETLICQIHGFYPKEIDASWMKDGTNWEPETFRSGVLPNSDGTYHTWLSIVIDPKERESFRCLVEHDSLSEPLDVAWEEPAGSSTHSLRYYYMAVTESSPGLPWFVSVGYVDDILFVHYDSSTRNSKFLVPWMKEMEKIDPLYWDQKTRTAQNAEAAFRRNLATAQTHYSQSGGFHTVQWMYGCELRKDGSTGGYIQDAYDGRDYISFDKETLTWTAANVPAQITKRKWEADPDFAERDKAYLEVTCIWWLKKFLEDGKEMLLRREPPVGKVTRKAVGDGQETLICQARGFYPKEIDANWKKGEDVMDHETFCRDIARNSDGTWHTWLSINIDPKERDLYQCHVDHASLAKPLVLAFEEPPGVNVGVIVGAILGVVAVLLVAGLAIFLLRNRQKKEDYKAALT